MMGNPGLCSIKIFWLESPREPLFDFHVNCSIFEKIRRSGKMIFIKLQIILQDFVCSDIFSGL